MYNMIKYVKFYFYSARSWFCLKAYNNIFSSNIEWCEYSKNILQNLTYVLSFVLVKFYNIFLLYSHHSMLEEKMLL